MVVAQRVLSQRSCRAWGGWGDRRGAVVTQSAAGAGWCRDRKETWASRGASAVHEGEAGGGERAHA